MRKDINRLPDEENGFLNSGKKTEVITVSATNANIAIKTGRQLFAKIPGVFVYDMDGSGNQLNISTRGLDAHRSWEFNIRQNGVIINSDMYGYPASHYSAPMESFEKIELIRGTGSLQYGAQFGGMINYITKRPDTSKVFSFESANTVGSFGLLSSYNAVSGTIKKFSYAAYYYKRHANGYRDNSQSDADAQFLQDKLFNSGFFQFRHNEMALDSAIRANPELIKIRTGKEDELFEYYNPLQYFQVMITFRLGTNKNLLRKAKNLIKMIKKEYQLNDE